VISVKVNAALILTDLAFIYYEELNPVVDSKESLSITRGYDHRVIDFCLRKLTLFKMCSVEM
jgi:hypothetical protein